MILEDVDDLKNKENQPNENSGEEDLVINLPTIHSGGPKGINFCKPLDSLKNMIFSKRNKLMFNSPKNHSKQYVTTRSKWNIHLALLEKKDNRRPEKFKYLNRKTMI